MRIVCIFYFLDYYTELQHRCIIDVHSFQKPMTATPLRYSHDLSREEIVSRYRDRIREGKRSKLGRTDLEQLILHFIDRLKPLKGKCQKWGLKNNANSNVLSPFLLLNC
jgi:hypothetical protein